MKNLRIPLLFFLAVLPFAQGSVIAHYSFDSDLTDSSGNGNHGTLTDVGTAGNTLVSTADSVFGNGSISFSNERDYVGIAEQNFSTTASYTIAFWAKRNSATRTYNVVAGNRNDQDNFLALFHGDSPVDGTGNGSQTYVRYEGNNPADDSDRRDYAFAAGTEWHHYAYVSDGVTMTIYVDGLQLGSSATETAFILNTIGVGYTADLVSDMQGRVDEFWIFDQALDANEVSSLKSFNAVPEPTGPLLAAIGGLTLLRRRRK